jgi:hypothetical protein
MADASVTSGRLEDLADNIDGKGRQVQHDGGGDDLLDGHVRIGLEGADGLRGLLGGLESAEHFDGLGGGKGRGWEMRR